MANNPNFSPTTRAAIKKNLVQTQRAYNDFINIEPTKREFIIERMSRIFKETYLGGKMDLRSYIIMTCSAIQSGAIEAAKK